MTTWRNATWQTASLRTAACRHLVALVVAASLTGHAAQLHAQGASVAYTVETEPFVHVDARTETALPIKVGPANMPRQAMVLLQGLTSDFTLSRGRLFQSGIWAVPTAELSRLQIVASSRAAGSRLPVTVSLVTLDGVVQARSSLTLVVREPSGGMETSAVTAPLASQMTGTASQVRPTPGEMRPQASAEADRRAAATLALATPEDEEAASSAAATPTAPAIAPNAAHGAAPALAKPAISPREETDRLKSAEEALVLNDVSGARLILEYLARRGSSAGAYRLAQTYDPDMARAGATGPGGPNKEKAAIWYAKAAELGHVEATRKVAGAR